MAFEYSLLLKIHGCELRDTRKGEAANPGEVDAVAAREKSHVRRLRNVRVGQERLIDADVAPPSS